MKKIIISPPFGNVIRHSMCTPVLGTFTWEARGSNITKIYRLLKTTRRIKDGWVNSVGLQNPGITTVKNFNENFIYSITAINDGEWIKFAEYLPKNTHVELNLSCPNINKETAISETELRVFTNKFKTVICKLSPSSDTQSEVARLAHAGVTHLHVFNTIPTARGGESGKRLQPLTLAAIKQVKATAPHVTVIAGGGVYSKEDIGQYLAAGADHVSLASIFLSPWYARKLLAILN